MLYIQSGHKNLLLLEVFLDRSFLGF